VFVIPEAVEAVLEPEPILEFPEPAPPAAPAAPEPPRVPQPPETRFQPIPAGDLFHLLGLGLDRTDLRMPPETIVLGRTRRCDVLEHVIPSLPMRPDETHDKPSFHGVYHFVQTNYPGLRVTYFFGNLHDEWHYLLHAAAFAIDYPKLGRDYENRLQAVYREIRGRYGPPTGADHRFRDLRVSELWERPDTKFTFRRTKDDTIVVETWHQEYCRTHDWDERLRRR
jgi:hypothetical protein